MRVAPKTAAQIGIGVQFAALIRCLGEFYRLKYTLGPAFTIARVEPFILGSLVTAIFLPARSCLIFGTDTCWLRSLLW
jgi:hypothetical protein